MWSLSPLFFLPGADSRCFLSPFQGFFRHRHQEDIARAHPHPPTPVDARRVEKSPNAPFLAFLRVPKSTNLLISSR